MKVELKTPFAEMTFEMSPPHATALLQQAIQYATGQTAMKNPEEPKQGNKSANNVVQGLVDPEIKIVNTPALRSRVETMFGSRETWNAPRPAQENAEAYKGFLYIRCESCGTEKGYNAKFPQTYHRCDNCNHRTTLRDMLPAFVHCKCGGEFKYQTNIQDRSFTMGCLSCGAPVDLTLNAKGTAYVPITDE